ncbi:MAG: deoxyribonuclease V [Candidatus Bathyarchaeota archaeon]|nr:deoxyribonuclease V [Candidatus Bathyarchaeota archaeon]
MSPSPEFSPAKAKKTQMLLSQRVILRDCLPRPLRYVAGVDVAYTDECSVGAVAVLNYETLRLMERRTSRQTTQVPYVPTFLAFRELPPAVSAIKKLRTKPDIFLVDGHGFAHPCRLGFASHLGVVLDAPTVGVAKDILCGEVKDEVREGWKPIIHKGEMVGGAVFTRPNVKPVYVSVGHKVSLETAINVVLHCSRNYRIPEPVREAHMAAEERTSI